MAAPGPALPWATHNQQKADVQPVQDNTAEEELQPVDLSAVGLTPGARIEVVWEVSTEEGEPYSKWFPATITSSAVDAASTAPPAPGAAAVQQPGNTSTAAGAGASSGKQQQQEQQYRYTLKYDGSEEFPEESTTVLLLAPHELYDVERRDTMVWRREGDTWEPPLQSDDESEEGEAAEEGAEISGMHVTPEDVAAADAAEAALMERLNSMAESPAASAYVQRGFEDFKAQFKAFVAAKASCAEGADSVLITTQDVQEFTAMMKTQRATAAARKR